MDEPFLLVVNPHAGAGAAERLLPDLRKSLEEAGARFDVAMTERPRDATRLVREALREGTAGIAVVGGDGTLNEAVNGFFEVDGQLVREGAWLGPLPCGTGGDFRRTIGTSKRVEPMVTRMLWARPRKIDVGWITFLDDDGQRASRAFINIASFGLSGKVDRVVNDGPKWIGGTPAFLLGTLRAMAGYRNQAVRMTLDDAEPKVVNILNVAIANGRYFGGGMMIAPKAEIDDGEFDVVTVEMSRREVLLANADVYLGRHLSKEGVSCERAKKVFAEPADPNERVLLDVDGEAPGRLPATFEIKPGAILLRG